MIKPQAYETEVIDKLFLELSQVTRATTGKELRLTERLAEVSVRAEKAEQESARLREALAWRPIETAPHHDWILLDCGNAGIVEGCYSTFEKEDAPRWFDSYGRTIYGPLHWIPLLDTPAAHTALGE